MDIYIANLHSSIEEEALTKLFEVFGEVTNTVLIRDIETRISKGYGFVKMPNSLDAERAIENMNGRVLAERNLVVKKAIPKDSKISQEKESDFIETKFGNRRHDINQFKQGYEPVEGEEIIPLEVKDETKYTKTNIEDGLIKVSFQN